MFWLLKKPLHPYKEKWKGSRQKFLTWIPTVGKERSEKLFFLHIFSLRNLISLQPVSKREKSALLQLQNNNAVCHVVLFNIFPVLQSHNRWSRRGNFEPAPALTYILKPNYYWHSFHQNGRQLEAFGVAVGADSAPKWPTTRPHHRPTVKGSAGYHLRDSQPPSPLVRDIQNIDNIAGRICISQVQYVPSAPLNSIILADLIHKI